LGLIYETSIYAFFFVTVLLGGGGAYLLGRAMAKTWKPFWQAIIFVFLLGAAIRFLHYGLFVRATLPEWQEVQGDLLSLHYYLADSLVLLFFAAFGFRLQRASQMSRQYGWLLKRTSPFTWTLRPQVPAQAQSGRAANS
jgi:p-aminobenzoyl-glutamate transporter AbgT